MALPTLTPEQRAESLAKAAAVRKARAQIKQDLKTGTKTIADLVNAADGDDIVGKMRVKDAIGSLPGYGPAKTTVLMERLQIAETRRLRGLGSVQRDQLLAELGGN